MLNDIKTKSTRTNRSYDAAFKEEALRHWLSSGKSAVQVAQELGIDPKRLYLWKKKFAPAVCPLPGAHKDPANTDLQAQLDAAHREIRHLREQRDILKKTLGILSEPPPNASNGSKQ